jgi:hypothetical protein
MIAPLQPRRKLSDSNRQVHSEVFKNFVSP